MPPRACCAPAEVRAGQQRWREDRRNAIAVSLLALALVVRLATAHDTYTWVSAVVLVVVTGWLARRRGAVEALGARPKPHQAGVGQQPVSTRHRAPAHGRAETAYNVAAVIVSSVRQMSLRRIPTVWVLLLGHLVVLAIGNVTNAPWPVYVVIVVAVVGLALELRRRRRRGTRRW